MQALSPASIGGHISASQLRFGQLNRDWSGRSVYLIGGGPSLKGFNFESLRGKGIIVAINDAILHVPFADVGFSIDTVWMQRRVEQLWAFKGEKVMAVPDNYGIGIRGVTYLHRIQAAGVSSDMSSLYTGENSGCAALSMAIMRGASRIALLGYDMKATGHFHKGYEWSFPWHFAHYSRWVKLFRPIDAHCKRHRIQVINCNPNSGLRLFPFGNPEDIAE